MKSIIPQLIYGTTICIVFGWITFQRSLVKMKNHLHNIDRYRTNSGTIVVSISNSIQNILNKSQISATDLVFLFIFYICFLTNKYKQSHSMIFFCTTNQPFFCILSQNKSMWFWRTSISCSIFFHYLQKYFLWI